jgi:hypothetical protein
MAEVVKHLPSKWESWVQNPNTAKNTKKKWGRSLPAGSCSRQDQPMLERTDIHLLSPDVLQTSDAICPLCSQIWASTELYKSHWAPRAEEGGALAGTWPNQLLLRWATPPHMTPLQEKKASEVSGDTSCPHNNSASEPCET